MQTGHLHNSHSGFTDVWTQTDNAALLAAAAWQCHACLLACSSCIQHYLPLGQLAVQVATFTALCTGPKMYRIASVSEHPVAAAHSNTRTVLGRISVKSFADPLACVNDCRANTPISPINTCPKYLGVSRSSQRLRQGRDGVKLCTDVLKPFQVQLVLISPECPDHSLSTAGAVSAICPQGPPDKPSIAGAVSTVSPATSSCKRRCLSWQW